MAPRITAPSPISTLSRTSTLCRSSTLSRSQWLLLLAVVAFSVAVTLLSANRTAAHAQNAGPFLPESPFDYEGQTLPEHYLTNAFEGVAFQNAAIDNDNTPASNPTTNAGATLGRVLFFDKKLSANGTASCASCHQQENGFASPVTVGFDGEATRRHTMSLTNARFYERGRFLWDEAAETLEDQVLRPFQNPVELGLTLDELVGIVGDQPYYGPLFADAFGDAEPTSDRIARALAQFVRSIVSANSRYDQGRVQVSSPFSDFPNFSPLENAGKSLFFTTGCSSCHVSEAFVNVDEGPKNNGLPVTVEDLGAFETFQDPQFARSFKVPSLRNVEVTGPFMHDGRFETLEEVIEHYSSGVQHDDPNLSEILVEPDGRILANRFSNGQKAAFVVFLKTLTDTEALTTERLSDPFVLRPVQAEAAPSAATVVPAMPVETAVPAATEPVAAEPGDVELADSVSADSTPATGLPDTVLYVGFAIAFVVLGVVLTRLLSDPSGEV